MKKTSCYKCGTLVDKDTLALNKKLLGRSIEKFNCLNCLAEHLECTEDDLLIKIDEFREQGCGLFK